MKFLSHILLLFACFLTYSGFAQNYSPIEFVENKGQWDKSVHYMAQVPAGALFIHNDGLTVLQHDASDWEKVLQIIHGHKDDQSPVARNEKVLLHSHSYKVQFLNALPSRQIIADKPADGYNNYFIGDDPSKWASNCKVYQGITIKNIYPNVDVRYYTYNGKVKYDLIVNPGANIEDIALKYNGVDNLEVKDRELMVATSVGHVKELAPYSYQYTAKERKNVLVNYAVQGNVVKFKAKNYDPNSTLVIDPTLVFVSFTGSHADQWGYTATYGPDGSMFAGGIVFGQGYPVTPGAFQQTWGGGSGERGFDIGITKLNARGTRRIFATYIGGSGNEQPHSLICDPQGNLIIAGRSSSPDYPTVPKGTAGIIGSGGGFDIIVTKLNANGTALIGSKRIGGSGNDGMNISTGHEQPSSLEQNYGDDARSEVILDGAGNIYLASCTQSTDFPVVNGFQSSLHGNQDAVVLELAPDVSRLLYSTYLGGLGNDAAYVLALNPFDGLIYAAGGTESSDFPGIRPGPMTPTLGNNNINGFVSIINTNGGPPSSIYLGTGGIDQVYGIEFDKYGYPYVTGQTTGTWPVKNPNTNPTFYADNNGKNFISKLEKDLSAFVYSTVFGTGQSKPNISPTAFLVDKCENVYVSGWGSAIGIGEFKTSAGTNGLKLKSSVIKNHTDGQDFYFFVLKRDAADQLYGDFFGQDGGFPDHVDGGTSRFDRNGVIYQAICANCSDPNDRPPFPTTPGVVEPKNLGAYCDLAMAKVAFNFSGVRAGPQASINGVPNDTSGCISLKVDFKDTVQNAVSYEWDFGDGSPRVTTTDPATSHTYSNIGTYKVMLIAIDPASCNLRDTAYTHIRAGDNQASPAFTAVRQLPCSSNKFNFTNTSTAPNGPPFGNQSFAWDFGDGSAFLTAGTTPVSHQYAGPGTYKVKLHLVDTAYCNAPDSAEQDIRISPTTKAQFIGPATGCAPSAVVFTNTSIGGQQFIWNFGDGSAPLDTSTETVSHIYTAPGTYIITLKAIDPAPCFAEDSATYTLTVYDKPKADFTATPQPPQLNVPITFTNLSLNATSYKWVFGDGDSLVTTSTQPFSHDYNLAGNYTPCLIAYNASGCTDTVCKAIQVMVTSSVDVPNAFTPLSGDINSRVSVRGYGITKLKFTIWNRWGQKMFETNSKNTGWDGRYKGVLQPMDVYAYTLDVEFADGKKATKHGDITLIR